MKNALAGSPPETAAAEQDAGYRIQVSRVTWVGLGVNVAITAFKCAAGVLGSSQAVIADALHSLTDTGSDLAILVGVKYWTAPADDCHPHGHRRIETVITIFIGLLLASAAGGLGYHAIATIRGRVSCTYLPISAPLRLNGMTRIRCPSLGTLES